MSPNITLCIVIVNYNVRYFLAQCLRSIKCSEVDFNYEVIVVDNASKDGSVAMVQQEFPTIQLIANTLNVGFAAANNQAIKMSQSEYVLLLNPDTILQEDTLQKAIDALKDNKRTGALGVKMYDGNGNYLPESKRGFPTPIAALSSYLGLAKVFPMSKSFGQYHLTYLDENKNHEVDVLSGACMFIRRSVLLEVGLLDEQYFMYGEDIDLSYSIIKKGYINYYLADTSIIHFKGESTKKNNLRYIKLFYGAMLLFVKKHNTSKQYWLLVCLLSIAIYIKAGLHYSSKLLSRCGYFLIDGSIVWTTLLALSFIFETYIKNEIGLIYPVSFYKINLPIYTCLYLLGILISGASKAKHNWKQLLLGVSIGFVAISVIYSFLPLSLRSSRGIIVISFGLNLFSLFTYRIMLRYFSINTNFVTPIKRYIVCCQEDEVSQYKDAINRIDNTYFVGFISEYKSTSINYLGTITELQNIIEIYQLDEIYIANSALHYLQAILFELNNLKEKVAVKLINQDVIISSSNKSTQAEITPLALPSTQRWYEKLFKFIYWE